MQPHPETAVAVGAMHVGRQGVPVVAQLIDEPEAKRHRIGKIDAGHRARQLGWMEDAVGGKREGALGRAALPAAFRSGTAAHRRRILPVEFIGHVPIHGRRQRPLQHTLGRPGQEHIVPLGNARRRQQPLAAERSDHDRGRGHPGARAPADLAGENDHRHDEQQQIRGNVVHRQADRRDGESESGRPAPPGAGAPGGRGRRSTFARRHHQGPDAASRACPNRPLRSMPIWLKSTPRTENRLFSGLCTVIRVGIVGCNYGRTVQLPAFRADRRCEVTALAGSNAARTAELARAADVPNAYGDWRALVEDPAVEAVAIATMPALQARDRAQGARTRQAGVRREAHGQHAR